MAKTRRSLSRIAQGVKNGFLNSLKFGSDRRRQVLEDLQDDYDFESQLEENLGEPGEIDQDRENAERTVGRSPFTEPVPDIDQFTQTQSGMIEFARRSFELGKIEEMRTIFLLLINNYTKELNENPTNAIEIQEKLNTKKEQLSEFDNAVTIIRTEEQIDNIRKSTNNILTSLNEKFERLIECLDDFENEKLNISVLIMNIENEIRAGIVTQTGYQVGTYYSNISLLRELTERYKDLSGFEYTSSININYFSDNQIRKIYGELESKIRILQGQLEKETDSTKKSNLKSMIENLDNLIQYLPSLLKNPQNFNKIKEETDSVLDRAFGERKDIPTEPQVTPPTPQPEPTPSHKPSNSMVIIIAEQHMRKIYEKIRQLATEFKVKDSELKELIDNFNSELNKVTNISQEEKNEIVSKIEERYNEKLNAEFGPETYNFICTYSVELENIINALNGFEFGTLRFQNAYKDLKDLISEMKSVGQNDNILVDFDENTQKLYISFPTDKVKPVVRQVVNDEVIAKIEESKINFTAEKEQELELCRIELEKIFDEYDKELERVIRELPPISNLSNIDKKLDDILSDNKTYPHLTYEDKKQLKSEIERQHSEMLDQRIGYNFIGFVYSIVLPKMNEIDFITIEKYEFGTLNFDLCYQELLNSVKDFKDAILSNPASANFISNISFDEETQKVRIDYKNDAIKTFEKQIVNNEILLKMYEDKKRSSMGPQPQAGAPISDTYPSKRPTPAPGFPQQVPPTPPQTPTTSSGIEAVQDYINKVNEVNYLIELLNEINSKLEAQAILNFVNADNAQTIISLEKEAKELDTQLISLKIELSKERLEIKKKHNVFVGTLPEVKANPIQTINFSGNLKDFVEQHDEMIVEAENKIIYLNDERKNNSHSSAELEEINNEITTLVAFIDAQNSLIGRRLVNEAKNIDIVEFLKERQENKRAMRERLHDIKNQKPVQPEKINESDLEKDYIEEASKLAYKLLEECVKEARETFNFIEPSLCTLSKYYKKLKELMLNPKFNKLPIELEEKIFSDVNEDYKEIIRLENLKAIFSFDSKLSALITSLTEEELSDNNLKAIIERKIESLKSTSYEYSTIDSVIDLENNTYTLTNNGVIFDFNQYSFVASNNEVKKSSLMSVEMLDKYNFYQSNPIKVDRPSSNNTTYILPDENMNIPLEAIKEAGQIIIDNQGLLVTEYQDFQNKLKDKYMLSNDQIRIIVENLENNNVVKIDSDVIIVTMNKLEFLKLISNLEKQQPTIVPNNEDTSLNEPEIKISTRQLSFNPQKQKQFADRQKDFIIDGDAVTISIIKNGIKIKYSQELRAKLSELNAKISLVNKNNHRIRTSEEIRETEQQLGFKDNREIDPNDYRIEIRVPDHNRSSVLFEYDLEQVEDEIKARSR